MNLSFLHPGLAWGLLAAAVPVAIHLFFRRRPKPLSFPAIDFILRARRETERRLRLKKVLLFTARTLLLAAIAAALARPRLEQPQQAAAAAARGPSAVAIVLDASASMRYRVGGGTLFDRARDEALEVLDGLSSEEPATVVLCGGADAPAAGAPTFDRVTTRRTLREAEPSFDHADMTSCVTAAAAALSDGASGAPLGKRVVVVTDMAASAWRLDAPAPMVQTAQGPRRPEVRIIDAARGAALPNTAITDVTVEPDPSVGPRGYKVTTTVVGFAGSSGHSNAGSGKAEDAEIQLHAGGPQAPVAIRSYAQVPQNGSIRKTLSYRFPQGGPAALSVTIPQDALDYDDVRAVTVSVPREVKALVVDGAPSPIRYRDEAFFTEAALSSPGSPVRATVVDTESLGKVKFGDFDVVFLLNVRSLGPRTSELRDFVERGGGLFIAMGDEVDPERYDAELGPLLPRPLHVVKTAAERGTRAAEEKAARFATVDWSHPALDVFTGTAREGFEGVRTWRYMLLKPAERRGPASDRVLVTYDDGAPALVEAKRGQGRVVLYTSTVNRAWSDWSIRTSFLPAIQRLAAWLTGSLETRRDVATPVGKPRAITIAEGQRLVSIVGPDGRDRPAASLQRPPGGPPTVVPDQPGLWQVKVEERGQTRFDPRWSFAALADPRESDTTRLEPQELTAYFGGEALVRHDGDNPGGSREIPLWSILLLLGIAAFVAEGMLLV